VHLLGFIGSLFVLYVERIKPVVIILALIDDLKAFRILSIVSSTELRPARNKCSA
jgi:hypothetical protein